jgi:tetratricopeptide (TPR) repeat protein
VWAQSYEGDLSGILVLQSEVAREIVHQVKIAVTPEEEKRLASARSVNPEAHSAYLRGRYFWSKRTKDGMQKAVKYFQEAIDIDPTYAPAYAGLADAYGVSGGDYFGLTPQEEYPKIKAAALKALELDDSLAEAHVALSHVKEADWDWQGSIQELEHALELNPSYAIAHAWLAESLVRRRRNKEAIPHARKAAELDPLSPAIIARLGWCYIRAGRFDQAIQQCHKALELESELGNFCLFGAYLNAGKPEQAFEAYEQMLISERNPDDAAEARRRYDAEGWEGVWHWELEGLLTSASGGEYVSPVQMAIVYSRLGDVDNALLWLEKAYQQRDGTLVWINIWQGTKPLWEPLWDDPRFQDLLRRLNLPP